MRWLTLLPWSRHAAGTGAALMACTLVVSSAYATRPASASSLPEMVLQDDAALLHRPADQVARTLDRLVGLGVDRVRLTANWSTLTRDADSRVAPAGFDAADPAAYEPARWITLDRAATLASARGLRVLIDVGFWAPVWATNDARGPRARSNIDPRHYADFAVAVARRYDGTFVPPVQGDAAAPAPDDAVLAGVLGPLPGAGAGRPTVLPVDRPPALPVVDEMALWNEPNHPALLLPQWRSATSAPTSPAVYRRMVLAAYPAVKRLRPVLRVLIGNTSSTGGVPGTGTGPVPPLRFLRQLACVDRRLRPITSGGCVGFTMLPGDGWAHHPYTAGQSPIHRSVPDRPDDVRIAELGRLSTLLDTLAERGRIAPANRRIHLTEFGYETHDIGKRQGLSQRAQAHWLTWAEYRATRLAQVVSVAQFLLGDQLPAPTRVSDSIARPFGQFYSGLLDGQGRDKLAVRSFTTGLFAQRRRDGREMLWVRLRGGDGRRTIRIQRRAPDGSWGIVETAGVPGGMTRDTFGLRADAAGSRYSRPIAPGGTYRVIVTGGARTQTGLPTTEEPADSG